MTDLETQIRGLVTRNPKWDTYEIAEVVMCSERTVRRVKQKMREEQDIKGACAEISKLFNHPHSTNQTALDTQVDGDHYKKLKIQPVEYIHANNIGFCEGTAIGYITRWRDKGGIKDLQKAIHTIQLLIELEGAD